MNSYALFPPRLIPGGLDARRNVLASRSPALDGARGIAALLVFGKHFCTLAAPWTADHGLMRIVFELLDVGSLGVDLFFLLSGYLIYGSLIRQIQPFGSYLARRLQRIYPTFLVVFALYALLMLLLPNHSKVPQPFWPKGAVYLVANLALLPGVFAIPPLMTVAWSLSFELAAYLGWPVVIGALRLRSWSRAARIVLLALGSVLILQCAPSQPEQPLIKFGVLLMGGLVWELTQSPAAPKLPGLGLVGLLAVVPLTRWLLITHQVYVVQRWILLCLVVLLYDLATTPGSVTGRVMSSPMLRRLGLISYSFYLIHGLTLHAVFFGWERLSGGGKNVLSLPGYLLLMIMGGALSISAALVLFLTVEGPYSFSRKSQAVGPG